MAELLSVLTLGWFLDLLLLKNVQVRINNACATFVFEERSHCSRDVT